MVDKLLHGYAYDAAGRLVKEGARTYRYGYLDKVLSVTEGKTRTTYGYHVDGQLASATKRSAVKPKKGEKPPVPETEEFFWDGLALVKRGGVSYVNEPHPGGGAAVLSSKDGVMFNDILGTTLGVEGEGGYTATPLTAFGDTPNPQPSTLNPQPSTLNPQPSTSVSPQPSTLNPQPLFTGKPHVDGLGHAFLFRNYRAGLGKWLTADPLGYPDGWNQLAYGKNILVSVYDLFGAAAGDIYPSLDDAAAAWGQEFNGASINSNLEYSPTFYENGNGYSYTMPNIGGNSSSVPSDAPEGSTISGYIHSHGAYDPNYENDIFSDQDISSLDDGDPLPGYLATPNGDLLKYDPVSHTTIKLPVRLPRDPFHPRSHPIVIVE